MGKCFKKNITLYSTQDGYGSDDSLNCKVLSFAFSLVVKIERNLISQRTKEALALRKAQATILGRQVEYSPKMNLLKHNREDIIKRFIKGESNKLVYKVTHR